jgi:hypothetical protein
LARALAVVREAEERLHRAKAACAALDADPDPLDRHEFSQYQSFEDYRGAQGGGIWNSGIDTGAAADAIRERVESE